LFGFGVMVVRCVGRYVCMYGGCGGLGVGPSSGRLIAVQTVAIVVVFGEGRLLTSLSTLTLLLDGMSVVFYSCHGSCISMYVCLPLTLWLLIML